MRRAVVQCENLISVEDRLYRTKQLPTKMQLQDKKQETPLPLHTKYIRLGHICSSLTVFGCYSNFSNNKKGGNPLKSIRFSSDTE